MLSSFHIVRFLSRWKRMILPTLILFLSVACSNGGGCKPAEIKIDVNLNSVINIIENILEILNGKLFGPKDSGGLANLTNGDFYSRNWEGGAVFRIYAGIVTDTAFKTVFYLCVVVFVSFLGINFAIGTTTFSMPELMKQLFKIAIIAFFASPAGWTTYLELIVKNVFGGARFINRYLTATVMNLPLSEVSSPFMPMNLIFGYILSTDFWEKIFAVILSNGIIYGWMFFIVILYSVATFGIIFFKAIIIYATLNVIAAILLSVGPIFIMLFMFDRTSPIGKKWLTHLFGNFMQQYMLFTAFFMFCVIASGMLRALVHFDVCWGPFMTVEFMIPLPEWFRSFVESVVNGIIRALNSAFGWTGVDIATVTVPKHILHVNIPIAFFFLTQASIAMVGPGFFDAASLLVLAMMFGKFIDIVADVGAEFASSDLKGKEMAPAAAYKALSGAQAGLDKLAGDGLKNAYKAPGVVSRAAATAVKAIPGVNKASNALEKKEGDGKMKGLGKWLVRNTLSAATGGSGPLNLLDGKKGPADTDTMNRDLAKKAFDSHMDNTKAVKGKDNVNADDVKKAFSSAVDAVKDNGFTGKKDADGKAIRGMSKDKALEAVDRTYTNLSAPSSPDGTGAKDALKSAIKPNNHVRLRQNFTQDVTKEFPNVGKEELKQHYLGDNSGGGGGGGGGGEQGHKGPLIPIESFPTASKSPDGGGSGSTKQPFDPHVAPAKKPFDPHVAPSSSSSNDDPNDDPNDGRQSRRGKH